MSTLTLTVKDIEVLKKAQSKLYSGKRLSSDERSTLDNFLASLPSPATLLKEKFPLDENFEIKVFNIEEMWPHMKKWLDLFNSLPKNGDEYHPSAGWLDAEEDDTFWKRNVIIEAEFIPSLAFSKREDKGDRTIGIFLKTDGTAEFVFWQVRDAEQYPDLYSFKGSWKEAYLLTVKTLQQGWPQTKFPEELLPLLKK